MRSCCSRKIRHVCSQLTTGQKILYYTLLVLLALVILFPIYYMMIVSLKLPKDIYRTPSLLPINATLQNYIDLFSKSDFLINIRNSFIVAGAVDRDLGVDSVVWRPIAWCGCTIAFATGSVG